MLAAAAPAAPAFPPLTGRVVDAAHVLPADVAAALTAKLAALEAQTGTQLVVATIPALNDMPIEDYGYRLGRAWGIGQKGRNTGAILIVAPADRKLQVEVGYGLEPVLTDALTSVIIQTQIVPPFKAGDLPGGIVAGTDALIDQLKLPPDQAQAAAAQATTVHAGQARHAGAGGGSGFVVLLVILFVIFSMFRRGGGGGFLPGMILGSMLNSRGGGSDWGGGGGGGSDDSFSGGGGSFGGGGSSGSW